MAFGHGHPLVLNINSLRLFVCDGAWVRHRKTTRPSPNLPDSRIPADWYCRGGCRAESVIEGRPALWCPARVEWARLFSGSQHGRCEHGRSLVPSTGGASTTVLWFPARAERGLEEERCAAAGERRGGGGQRRRKFKEEKCCSNEVGQQRISWGTFQKQ